MQHKQIRAGDRDHHDHSPGYHAPAGGGEYPAGVSYTAGSEYPTTSPADTTSPHSGGSWYDEPKAAPLSSPPDEGENREGYEGESPEKGGADLHRSGLGNLEPLRNALPDITGQGG